MDIKCKNCGGDVDILSNSGGVVKVKCTCCGSVYEHTPRASSAPSVSASQNLSGRINEMAGEDIYDRNIRAVVEITTEAGRASGYLVSSHGIIVTNTHAVTDNAGQPCRNVRAKINGKMYGAKIIALGDDHGGNGSGVDLALLGVDGDFFDCVRLGSSISVRNGESVYYIGNSQGEGTCITGGIVSDKDRVVDGKHYIMTDAATNPGNSGGPLIDRNGDVIGTHVSARVGAVGMKYAIPVDTVKDFIMAVARKAEISADMLCDTRINQREDFSLIWSGIKLLVEGIMYIKNLITRRRSRA